MSKQKTRTERREEVNQEFTVTLQVSRLGARTNKRVVQLEVEHGLDVMEHELLKTAGYRVRLRRLKRYWDCDCKDYMTSPKHYWDCDCEDCMTSPNTPPGWRAKQ